MVVELLDFSFYHDFFQSNSVHFWQEAIVSNSFYLSFFVLRCNGKGIRPGRPPLTPKPEMFPCHLCGRKLATQEAHESHVTKCDGTVNNSRGRKPADNTCMVRTFYI